MSKWTHSICLSCWNKKYPRREAHVLAQSSTVLCLVEADIDTCCYCGMKHKSGIYVRDNPEILLCKGIHNEK